MNTAKSIAHNSNICSVQYNLFDFGPKIPTFEEKVESALFDHKKILNIDDRLHLISNNHFEYINPVCPECGRISTCKQEFREKNPVLPIMGKTKVYVRRYKCKCGKKFEVKLKNLLKANETISHVIKDKLRETAKKGYKSLRDLAKDLEIHANIKISHQTIKNILSQNVDDEIKNDTQYFSTYYGYDEQFLRKKPYRVYRLLLYDALYDVPIAEKIVKTRSKIVIKHFIEDNLKNQPRKAIVTDHFKLYRKLMTELGFNHQLCIFHLFQMITKKHIGYLKSKKVSKIDKMISCRYMTEFREIFRSWTLEESKNKLDIILTKLEKMPDFLSRFIQRKVITDFDKLTNFLKDGLIPSTSNCCESYFSKTLPKSNKNRFRTNNGYLSYLYYYMQKSIETFKKKFYFIEPPNF